MRTPVTSALTLCAALALAVPLAIVSPAQAATYNTLGERALNNSSLGASDVPRWMQRDVSPRVERNYLTKGGARAPILCVDADGQEVTGPKPRQRMTSEVTTRVNIQDFRFIVLTSDIYQYPSRSAAEQAWSELQADLAQCPVDTTITVEEGPGITVQFEVRTQINATPALFGTPGISVFQDLTQSTTFPDGYTNDDFGDGAYTMYLSGTSIVAVTLVNFNGEFRGIGRVSRNFVDTTAIVVAQRVQRRSLR